MTPMNPDTAAAEPAPGCMTADTVALAHSLANDRPAAATGTSPMSSSAGAHGRLGCGWQRYVRVAAGRASLGVNAGFAELAARFAAPAMQNFHTVIRKSNAFGLCAANLYGLFH